MKKLPYNLLSILILIIFSSVSFCGIMPDGEPEVVFGEFSRDELEKTSYSIDTSASAIILYEKGEASFKEDFDIKFTKHVRIKILNKEGIDWGNIVIPYRDDERKEKIKDIKGFTAYIDDNGKMIKKELDKHDIYEEELSKTTSCKRFMLPAIQPGCIIEYCYTMESEYVSNFPDEWEFQHSIPALWSEFVTQVPGLIKYAIFKKMSQTFYIDKEKEIKCFYDWYPSRTKLTTDYKRLVMKNSPAIVDEPFMKSPDNYRSKVTYQVAEYYAPYPTKRKGIQTWEDVGREFMSYEKFGEVLTDAKSIKKTVEEVIGTAQNDEEKLTAIYNYVTNSIVWNGKKSMYSLELKETIKRKTGDSGDINLLLVAMLRDAGIESYPVVLSTRSNVELYTNYPIVDQLNYVIAFARVDSNQLLLDATDKLRPFSMLPVEALNSIGLMIRDTDVQWVKISPSKRDYSIEMISAELDSNGSISGIMRITNGEYAALSERKRLENMSEEDYIKDKMDTDVTGIVPDSIKIDNGDKVENPLLISFNFEADSYAQMSGDMMIVDPFINKMKENPFKAEKRDYPVEFPYPVDYSYTITLTIPDGYTLEEYPASATRKLGIDDAGYKREVKVEGNTVTVSTRFYVNTLVFDKLEYSKLKAFFDQVVSFESEMLILRKGN